MALINNIYIHITDEQINNEIESTTHPVEKGIELTDTIRKKPVTLSLKGKVVDYGSMKASAINSKLLNLMKSASLINYAGRNTASNMQIQSYNTTHPNTNSGGLDFDMELKEVRIAKNSYNAKKATNSATTAAAKKNNPTLKVGAIVVFTGGSVYVSSDATKAAATRGRSTCKITIISTASWSKHQYHLISTDGKMVYGWVDKSKIEGTGSTTTASQTKSGTQQVKTGNGTAVYHTVKKGETVWGLVNNNYKELNTTCNWVISNNPKAFSTKGDPRTLQIGAKLLMGYKK